MKTGYIHSLESFGSADGPGVRYLVFLQGCNMRCQYCHNPDTWKTGGGTEMTTDEILDKAERFRSYWGEKGGITVSGGEPLLQIDFLTELFKTAKSRDIHTCIDTAGQPFSFDEPFISKFNELMKYTDLLLVDIKHIDSVAHKRLTGAENRNILDMLRYLSNLQKPVWIRHVLVPGITDNDEYLNETRAFLDTLKNIEKVEVLPYHTMGTYKWKEMGMRYSLENTAPPTKERLENAKKILGVS